MADAPTEQDVSSRRVRCGQSLQCLETVGLLAAEGVPRPQTSGQTIAQMADPSLWNIGFDDNCNDPYTVWDCGAEVYRAWGGNDEWGEIEADWGTEVIVF
jgi:hypothetical protein